MARRGRRLARIFLIAGGVAIIGLMVLEIVYFMAPALIGAGVRRTLRLTLYVPPPAAAGAEKLASSLAKAFNAGRHSVVVVGASNTTVSAAVLYSRDKPILVVIAPANTLKAIAGDSQLASRLLDYALTIPDNETLVFIPGAPLEKIPRNTTAVEELVKAVVGQASTETKG